MGRPDDVRVLHPRRRVAGVLRVPGDKSISHRALIFAAMARGRCVIRGAATGADVRSTRAVLERLGVAIAGADDALVVEGNGLAALDRDPRAAPAELDCGNSGTTARLLLGLLAGRRGRFRLVGDASLSRRPMRRVTAPLARLGARIGAGETLPLEVEGGRLRAGDIEAGVASAQVKSALVLAALQADGRSTIRVPGRTRDHTERMLAALGAPVRVEPDGDGERLVVDGALDALASFEIDVPGDPSSAAFLAALACLLPDSRLEIEGVSLNPTRLGFVGLLERMGARIGRVPADEAGPEPRGTLVVESAVLAGIDVGPADVAAAIDEIPLLAVVASRAAGRTTIRGAAELRVKESDRIRATCALLEAFGVPVEEFDDGLAVTGGAPLRGASVDAAGDHRIAMCAAVLAALADRPSRLTGARWVSVSWPSFFDELERLAPRR
ncbi:MAG: 3-phosphoshikimate 1-carboxyvinyltransferase [Acidobacteriota bacterium]